MCYQATKLMILKKLILIFFLIVLLMQAGGAWVCLKIQQFIAQHEMEEDIDEIETCFEKMSISLEEYTASKINNKEVSIKGKMYDIKSVTISNNIVELVVINDTKEEKILERIKKLTEANHRHGRNLPYYCLNLTTLFYIYPDSPDITELPIFLHTSFRNYSDAIFSHYSGIQSPPPKFG